MPFYCDLCNIYFSDLNSCPNAHASTFDEYIENGFSYDGLDAIINLGNAASYAAHEMKWLSEALLNVFNVSEKLKHSKSETPNTEIYLLDDTYNTDDSL